ncbi:15869_t:CDS:1, partial [Acaulospora colombiana]
SLNVSAAPYFRECLSASDLDGLTPLMYAAFVGEVDAAKTLLSKPGVQVNQTKCKDTSIGKVCDGTCGTSGWTALHYAVYSQRLDMLKLLLEHSNIDIDLVSHGTTALGLASEERFLEGVKTLIDAGAGLSMFSGKALVQDSLVP